MEEIKKKRLMEIISLIGGIKGKHTELVSVYIPADYSLDKVVAQIRTEQSTAQNIKSKAVRKNVMAALERILQHLRLYKHTPPKGLVVFCGNASDKEGVADIELWAIEPPEPLGNKLYWCGQNFILDPLLEMVKETEVYGLIVLDKSEADIGLLKGKKIHHYKHLESLVPGKTRKGGWCVYEDSLLQTENEKVKIKDIADKKFLCYDFNNSSIKLARHKHIFCRKSQSAYKIETEYPRLKIIVTKEHRFFVPNNGRFITKHAEDLKKGGNLLYIKNWNNGEWIGIKEIQKNSDLISVKIASIKRVRAKGFFYDMEVPRYENFIANGLILHNSANRYARIREGLLEDFMKRIGEIATEYFKGTPELKGVIIGGPGPIKEKFNEGKFLSYDIKKIILGVVDTSYTGEFGLNEILEKSESMIAETAVIKEKKILERFFENLGKDTGLAVYGLEKTVNALKAGNVDMLLISESFDLVKVGLECNCGNKKDAVINRGAPNVCEKCGKNMIITAEKDVTDDIINMAETMGTRIEMISVDTPKGEQLKGLGGIAGILRFKMS